MSAASCWAARSSGSASALASAFSASTPVDPAVELDLGQAGLGGVVLRGLGEDLLVRRLGRVQVAGHQGVVGGVQPRVLGGGDVDAAGLEHRVDVLPDLRLGQHAGEALDELAADDRDHHRDALYAQGLGEPRVGVHVDLAEHPAAAALGGELLQHRARAACRARTTRPRSPGSPGWSSSASSTVVWKFASVTSMTAGGAPPGDGSRRPARRAVGAAAARGRGGLARGAQCTEVDRAAGEDRRSGPWVAHGYLVSHAPAR